MALPRVLQATTTGNLTCSRRVDLMFVLDESGSIGANNYVNAKQFIIDVSNAFTVSQTQVRQRSPVQFEPRGVGAVACRGAVFSVPPPPCLLPPRRRAALV